MKKKFIVINSVVISLGLISLFVVSFFVNRSSVYKEAETSIVQLTESYRDNYSLSSSLVVSDSDVRVTIINKDGSVLVDSAESDVSLMENHLEREEIQAALKGTPKVVYRDSSTIEEKMLYYALTKGTVSSGDYYFVRVSLLVKDIDAASAYYAPWLICSLGVVIIASIVASWLSSQNAWKPLEKVRNNLSELSLGLPTTPVEGGKDKDLNDLLIDISNISNRIQSSIEEAKKDKLELSNVLDNVSDLILSVTPDKKVSFMNKKAMETFHLDKASGFALSSLSSEQELISRMDAAFSCKEPTSSFILYEGKSYRFESLKTGNDETLFVFNDVTAEKEGERMRQEFFANSSHELKTPLTSIMGFSDLLSLQNKDPSLSPYVEKIRQESSRMLSLIQDMLSLSKLEEDEGSHPVDLALDEVVNEAFASLKELSYEKKVSLSLDGSVLAYMDKDHAYTLFRNLIENGIKYNEEKGYVKVVLSSDKDGKPMATISDNGIGIAPADQTRIFERFYRVDKSRSRSSGGTGLGLSIVKHIAEKDGIVLSLSSKLGEGTTVKLVFPKTKKPLRK